MMKFIILFLLILLLVPLNTIIAQDVIIKHNGEEVKSKVIKVGKTDITYKNFEDPEFSNSSIKVQEVKMIRFEDGTEKIFKTFVQHYISFSMGKNLAVGDYGSHNLFNDKAGYAQGGRQLTLETGIYLKKNFGLCISLGAFSNRLDTAALKNPYKGLDVTYNFDKRENWTGTHMLVGPLYTFKIGNRFAVEVKILGGALILNKPSWGYHYKDASNQDYDYSYESGTGTSLGINLGTAFRYNFSKRLGLKLSMDFIKAEPYVHYKIKVQNPGQPMREEHNTLVQKVEIVKVGLGLVLLLNR